MLKTTLLRLLAGLEFPPDSGELQTWRREPTRRESIAEVFRISALSALTVFHNDRSFR